MKGLSRRFENLYLLFHHRLHHGDDDCKCRLRVCMRVCLGITFPVILCRSSLDALKHRKSVHRHKAQIPGVKAARDDAVESAFERAFAFLTLAQVDEPKRKEFKVRYTLGQSAWQ